MKAGFRLAEDGTAARLHVFGPWTLQHAASLDRLIGRSRPQGSARVIVDADELAALDTTGAWLLLKLERLTAQSGAVLERTHLPERFASLLARVENLDDPRCDRPPQAFGPLEMLVRLGETSIMAGREAAQLLNFFGMILVALGRALLKPWRIRLTALLRHVERTGVDALPIIGMISFLIGVVLAYQGADQLRRFGADVFTVNLLGLAVLREMGVLLTAIMVAGRSGSAFTAQIGTMQVNEEVDALRTMGLDVVEVLVLPRVLALMIALPLLACFADIMGLFGGGLICYFVLDITPGQFITQLREAVGPAQFWAGLAKAPVFAFLIAMTGCYHGLKVSGSAESVGLLTTRSVVVAIFLVIIVNAMFSITYASYGL